MQRYNEKRIIQLIDAKKNLLFIITITLLGIFARFSAKDFISADAEVCLLPWFEAIKPSGFAALKNQIGNYGIPYQFLIAIMTYFPDSIPPIYLYKTLSCIFDFGLAFISARFVRSLTKNNSPFLFCLVYGTILLFPTIILNSSAWAQCDSIYVFFIVAALYSLYEERYLRTFILTGIAFGFKLQTVFIVPFIIYYYVKERKFSIVSGICTGFFSFYIMQIPGLLFGRPLLEPLTIYTEQTQAFKEMWLNFPSFWALTGNNYVHLHLLAIIFTISLLGTCLFVLMHVKADLHNSQTFIKLLIWSIWTCLLFLPAMHERYAYLLDLLILISIFAAKRNTQYIYIYIYISALYCSLSTYGNFLFNNSTDIKSLSILYTLAYLAYSCILIKHCPSETQTHK